ncbi:MAG: hypothetical protein AUH72_17375 [Acidobacteria bacterium 13_1_40CM_4_65_8]|jgi:hypothetical protein|nr:MAG: hypothetical protein AUH72_17375 [Acidobacteria bacterium 13_1_40CM_4_65_8]
MRGRALTILSALAAAIAIAPLAGRTQPTGTVRRAWTPPRTASGDIDLQGIWNYATMTPLERPRELSNADVLTAEQAAAYERQINERQGAANSTAGPDWWDPGTRRLTNRRTSLIVDPPDGRVPTMIPDAQARATARAQAARDRGPAEGPEDLGLNVRCLVWSTAGPPMLPGVYNNNVDFVQTRDYIVIVNEMIHDARIVPMDGRPHGTVPRWMGDSRGRWDAGTLVIDTIAFTDKTNFRGADEKLHLVERFTRVDADTIEYQFTAEDPTVWTRSWTAAFPLHKTSDRMYEYACHEGNARSVEGILRASRVSR